MAIDLAHTIIDGSGDKPPVLFLHGLYGQGRNWGGIAQGLDADRHRVLVDLRNHGASPWDDDMRYDAMAADVARLIETVGGRAAVIGHSLGGKVAMILALTEPAMVDRLVVVDIGPTEHPAETANFAAILKALPVADLDSRAAAGRRLSAEIADPGVRNFLLQSLTRGTDGGFVWRLNLDAIISARETMRGFPAPENAVYRGATLVIAGGASPYIGTAEKQAFDRFFPGYRLHSIADAGHWVHSDAAAATTALLRAFL